MTRGHYLLAILVLVLAFQCNFGMDLKSFHKYQYFPEAERIKLKEQARNMFYFGYENYMKFAFPKDELNPLYCSGRGPDYDNP